MRCFKGLEAAALQTLRPRRRGGRGGREGGENELACSSSAFQLAPMNPVANILQPRRSSSTWERIGILAAGSVGPIPCIAAGWAFQ